MQLIGTLEVDVRNSASQVDFRLTSAVIYRESNAPPVNQCRLLRWSAGTASLRLLL